MSIIEATAPAARRRDVREIDELPRSARPAAAGQPAADTSRTPTAGRGLGRGATATSSAPFRRHAAAGVADHASVGAVLRDRPDGFRRHAVTAQVSTEMGGSPGLFLAEGDAWRDQRRMVMAGFAPPRALISRRWRGWRAAEGAGSWPRTPAGDRPAGRPETLHRRHHRRPGLRHRGQHPRRRRRHHPAPPRQDLPGDGPPPVRALPYWRYVKLRPTARSSAARRAQRRNRRLRRRPRAPRDDPARGAARPTCSRR